MVTLILPLLFSAFPYGMTGAQSIPEGLLDSIEYREIGPTAQSGRFVDFAVPLQQPYTFYAATASGGLWKSENAGLTYSSLLDETDIISLGDVTVAPSDPNIVWIGTGEANNSRSAYFGDGVYKSTDAGSTWVNMGLPESHHIGRIVIHPRDPDVVYVAALGHLYSANAERGLFKTTDGGRTWTKVLNVTSEGRSIGVVDVVMHPTRPNTLFAAAYDKVRRPWTFNEGGPGSGIHKTTNGGRTWTKLDEGLPGGMLGRIGLTISPQNPNTLYAVIENANSEGVSEEVRRQELLEGRPPSERTIGNEVYMTSNGGRSWQLVNTGDRNLGGNPPYYYGQIIVDPNDKEHLYNLGVGVSESTDGGRTWERAFRRFGGDNHALWINPDNSKHILLGYDHGMGVTYDGGDNWYHPDNQSLAQLYSIGADNDYPYNVYGGLQDNGSVKGPSTSRRGNIEFEEWTRVGGGDGMYNVPDPNNPDILYNESQFGPIRRLDQATGVARSIRHRAEGLRFNWSAPILISPHNSDVIFHGANILLRSPYRGEKWEEISPDLTTADSTKIVGTGNIQYGTITTVDESPVVPGVILVGTDDGNVQLTLDGGENWTLLNDRIPDNPQYWVSRVVASFHDPATAYVTYTGLRRDDFRPFVYKTTDNGETWTSISANLPDEPVNVIREDRVNSNLLFVGTDKAVYVSLNGGDSWSSLRNNMPAVAVHDLLIHEREKDLVVGTHGRGFYIADISPLQEMSRRVLESDMHLFQIESKIRWISPPGNASSRQNFRGQSEPNGVVINYFLKNDAEDVTIRVYQGTRLINEIEADTTAGLNSALWNMQGKRPRTPQEKEAMQRRGSRGGGGGGGGGFQMRGQQTRQDPDFTFVPVQPGTFRVVIDVDGKEMTGSAVILRDHWYDR